MTINNPKLNTYEKKWLEAMLVSDYEWSEALAEQINNSEIKRDYTDYYLSLLFQPDKSTPPAFVRETVPLDMRLFRENRIPMQFLLHVVEGYVTELEIYNADSSYLDSKISLDGAHIEVVVEEVPNKSWMREM